MRRKLALSFLFICLSWLAGLLWFASVIPAHPAPAQTADAIVVLTGGPGRLEYGLKLLAERRAKKLFVSGVSPGVKLGELVKTPLSGSVALGHQAVNTIGNADEAEQWMRAGGYSSLLLVTAAYHMPRSLEEFSQAAPGLTLIPAPMFPENFPEGSWWNTHEGRLLLLSEYHKFIASKLRHWFVSATRGA